MPVWRRESWEKVRATRATEGVGVDVGRHELLEGLKVTCGLFEPDMLLSAGEDVGRVHYLVKAGVKRKF